MTAKEAGEKADKAHIDINNEIMLKYLPKLEKGLQGAISKGEKAFYYYESMPDILLQHLKSLGYTMTYQASGYNESAYKITF